jgi:molybdopterin converting factor small subunit
MKINVRFAGFYRTLAGKSSLDLNLPEGVTVEDAMATLDEFLEGRLHEVFYPDSTHDSHPDLLVLVNTEIVSPNTVLQGGDVLAFVPPMAGGRS